MQQINKKRKGTTLAEVMIALIIIGIIGAITVPVLKKHTQREETITKLKKSLMTMEQLIDAAIIDQGDINNGMDVRWNMDNLFTRYMIPEMQIARNCSVQDETQGGDGTGADTSKCFPDTIYNLDGTESNIAVQNAVVLMDGTSIGNMGMDFYVDLNGPTEPNVDGVDIFHFVFTNVDRNESTNEPGDWKFLPEGHAKEITDANWRINYW